MDTDFQTSDSSESVAFYHNGHRSDPKHYRTAGRPKPPPLSERKVIAWDMEGMNLSGNGRPQHAVIFGCSAEASRPLVDSNLQTLEMLDYMIAVSERYPHALHVGFGFRYDSNMLVKGLPQRLIVKLWRRNHCRFREGDFTYNISWIPGKRFAVSRWLTERKSSKISVNVHDYASFFGKAFLTVAEDLLRDGLSREDRDTIAQGKKGRASNTWSDLPEVRYYWEREIQLIRRTFERFRDVMVQAGFPLKDWYGPGALANFINATRGIRPHLGSVQVTSGDMPKEVHEASKVAFSGGRFEPFMLGRFTGPIYSVDINSAYPAALTMIPSLHPDEGEWRHVESPDRIKRFGFYRITYRATNARPFEARPMPLFWRDPRGFITYPGRVTGWYPSPEARMMLGVPGATIHEGWHWDSREEVFPWEFLHEMFERRMRLGKQNLLSMPFKLGPNSLYGKYAQTVGWNRKQKLPPRSHALPVAAWVTSYCRSQLWNVIRQIPAHVIAVETDSVFTTVDPSTLDLRLGNGLGEWSASTYDEILYLQSGMYHTREGDDWTGTRSRGLLRSELNAETSAEYLRSLVPGTAWKPLPVRTKPRFIGAGMALASAEPFHDIHCSWREQERLITLGETGKRRHARPACQACQHGSTPYDEPHRMFVVSKSDGEIQSFPRRLPWESPHPEDVWHMRKARILEGELITR